MADQPQRQYLEHVPVELQDLLYAGRKIEAIKLARAKLGWGLKEAKDKVDEVENQMRKQFPGALPDRRASGCGTALLLVAILVGIAIFLRMKAS